MDTASQPREEQLAVAVNPLMTETYDLVIDGDASYQTAAEILLRVQSTLKNVEEVFRESKQKTAEAHAAVCAAEKKWTEPLERARNWLKSKMSGYLAEQAQLQESLKRQAREQEALRHAQEIERQASEAELRGASLNEVKMILEQPAPLSAPASKAVTRIRGISTSEEWFGEITDLPAFLKAALADRRLLAIVEIHQGKLNSLVRLLKDTLRDVPGLQIGKRPSISASRQGGMR